MKVTGLIAEEFIILNLEKKIHILFKSLVNFCKVTNSGNDKFMSSITI
jgi:hypothetical protein